MGYSSSDIRNVGLIAHGGAGKTSLAESILFNGGSITRLGRVDDGNTVMDFDPDEIKRKISINAAVAFVDYKGKRINIIDMPGYADFIGEVLSSIRVCDSVVSVVCAVSGVEVNTEKTWEYATELGLPKMVFINKLDRERADFYRVYEMVRNYLSRNAIPILIPIGAEQSFKGVVDLLKGKAYIYEKDKSGKFREEEIPADLKDKVSEMKEMLIEKIVETDETLMERYLNGEEVSPDEIVKAMKKAVLKGEIIPVLCGSSTENIGIRQLMDYIIDLLPSPVERPFVKAVRVDTGEEVEKKIDLSEPFSAWAFKVALDPYVGKLVYLRVWSGEAQADATVLNSSKKEEERLSNLSYPMGKSLVKAEKAIAGDIVLIAKPKVTGFGDTLCAKDAPITFPAVTFPEPVYFLAIEPKTKGDEDRLSNALQRLMEADPTFKSYKNVETGDTVIAGMGDIHLEVAIDRMKSRYNVELNVRMPKIPYRETIKGKSKAEGKYVKQSGGRGQYGWVWIEYEPLPRGSGFQFEDRIVGGVVPKQYIPAVEKGLREAMQKGVLAGYPTVDFKAILYDGKYHEVDSSEMAFKIAASLSFKKGISEANPVLLEPIMEVEVTVPEDYLGDVMGDLNSRRGRILGIEAKGRLQTVKALVPMAEMARYAITLRSITSGRGSFRMSLSHYEEVPPEIAKRIIEEAQKEQEEEKR